MYHPSPDGYCVNYQIKCTEFTVLYPGSIIIIPPHASENIRLEGGIYVRYIHKLVPGAYLSTQVGT